MSSERRDRRSGLLRRLRHRLGGAFGGISQQAPYLQNTAPPPSSEDLPEGHVAYWEAPGAPVGPGEKPEDPPADGEDKSD